MGEPGPGGKERRPLPARPTEDRVEKGRPIAFLRKGTRVGRAKIVTYTFAEPVILATCKGGEGAQAPDGSLPVKGMNIVDRRRSEVATSSQLAASTG